MMIIITTTMIGIIAINNNNKLKMKSRVIRVKSEQNNKMNYNNYEK